MRKNWIDWCKAFALYLVVLGHFSPVDNLTLWLYTFHIPLFFIISGYLCSKKEMSFKATLAHNAKILLIPYAFFVSLSWCIELIISKLIWGGAAEPATRIDRSSGW